MTFKKGQSGNPGGRAVTRTKDGRTLSELAREHTEEAVETLLEVMRDKDAPAAARNGAASHILDRGWGRPQQTVAIETQEENLDLSGMNDEQLEAIETIRSLAPLTDGVAGSC